MIRIPISRSDGFRGEIAWNPEDAKTVAALWLDCEQKADRLGREPGECAIETVAHIASSGASKEVSEGQTQWALYAILAELRNIIKHKGGEEPLATAFSVAVTETTVAEVSVTADDKLHIELSWKPAAPVLN
jgi:hypothetical protein